MKTIILFILLTFINFAQDKSLVLFFSGEATYDAETLAYQTLIDSAGGTISTADLQAIDVFVNDIQSIRSKIVRFNPFAGDSLPSALVPLFRGTAAGQVIGNAIDINTNFVSADYTRTGGLGDASNSTKYLNTGVNASTTTALGLQDAGLSFWSLSDAQSTGTSIGANVTSGDYRYMMIIRNTSNQTYNGVMTTTGRFSTSLNSVGLFTCQRVVDSMKTYKNGARVTVITPIGNSNTETNAAVFVFARNSNGSILAGSYVPYKSSGYAIHKAFTDAEAIIFYNAWNKLKTAFGR